MAHSRRTPTMRTAALLALGLTFALGATLGSAGVENALAADDPDGMGITVQVTPSPVGSVSTGTGVGSTTSQRPGTGAATGSTPVATPDAEPVDDNGEDIGGILYLSGLSTTHHPSLNPVRGELIVEFTVRNASDTAMDATAHFWVDGPFGNTISDVDSVPVTALAPGESRVVSATLPGIGQWTILNAHAVFTPPSSVDGVSLTAVTRDGMVMAAPWFLILVFASGGALYGIVRAVRRVLAARIVPELA